MAGCTQQFLLFFVSAMLSSYLVCQQTASGMAVKETEVPAEAIHETDHSDKKLISVEGNKFRTDAGEVIELFPVSEPHLQLQFNSSRRRLSGDFLGCSSCRCCDSSGNNCSDVDCCYTISCSSYPYGFCKFVPVYCNCVGCG